MSNHHVFIGDEPLADELSLIEAARLVGYPCTVLHRLPLEVQCSSLTHGFTLHNTSISSSGVPCSTSPLLMHGHIRCDRVSESQYDYWYLVVLLP